MYEKYNVITIQNLVSYGIKKHRFMTFLGKKDASSINFSISLNEKNHYT